MYKTITYFNEFNSEEHTIRIKTDILDGLQKKLDEERTSLIDWLQVQFMDLTNGGDCEINSRTIRNVNEKIRIRILEVIRPHDF
ncbi:MAG: hypothetical protein CTY10_02420 [Methylotenera sp.]|nr:MAG: hypothetical protein CTY10_02420 [Methylotenera sp.]